MMKSLFNKPIVLIAFALLIKIIMIGYVVKQAKTDKGIHDNFISSIVIKTSDYGYFIEPVENYFKDGAGVVYYTKPSEPFAGRMPGYWFPYWIIRLGFSSFYALNILIVLQILLSSLSVFYLAKAAFNIYQNIKAFYFVYFLFLLTPYILSFDLFTQSESFAVSASIFHLYFFSNYVYKSGKKIDLFFSGFFLAWLIFLRPFTGIAILFVPLFLFLYSFRRKEGLKAAISNVLVFCLVFIIFEVSWTTRNYVQLKKLIPLESSLEDSYGKLYSKPWIQIRQMIVTFGEDAAYFEPGTMSAWFKNKGDSTVAKDEYAFKKELFQNVSFTKDSIVELKQKYHAYMDEMNPEKEKLLFNDCLNTSLRYQKEYSKANFFKVYVKYPCIRFCKFIFNSGSSYLIFPPFSKMNLHQKNFKLFSSFTYYISIVLGFAGILIVLWKRNFKLINVFLVTHIAVIICLVVFYIDIQENRYLMTVFPYILLFSFYPVQLFINWRNKSVI